MNINQEFFGVLAFLPLLLFFSFYFFLFLGPNISLEKLPFLSLVTGLLCFLIQCFDQVVVFVFFLSFFFVCALSAKLIISVFFFFLKMLFDFGWYTYCRFEL